MAKAMHTQQQNQDLNISLSVTTDVPYPQGVHVYQSEGTGDPIVKCYDAFYN